MGEKFNGTISFASETNKRFDDWKCIIHGKVAKFWGKDYVICRAWETEYPSGAITTCGFSYDGRKSYDGG